MAKCPKCYREIPDEIHFCPYCMEIELKSGEPLKKGEFIGYINRPTSYYTLEGSHLYLKMIKNGKTVDPTDYLER